MKILIVNNKINFTLDKKYLKFPVPITVEYKEVSLPIKLKTYDSTERGRWGLDDSIRDYLRVIIPDKVYHAVIFLYDWTRDLDKDVRYWNNWTPLHPNTEFIQGYRRTGLSDEWISKTINHELYHSFFNALKRKGIYLNDPMDMVYVRGNAIAYYNDHNWDAKESNRTIALDILKPYWGILEGMRTLRKGSRGEDVKQLQTRLGITADGIFGTKTMQAVKDFQRSKGLFVDGVVGVNTRKALKMSLVDAIIQVESGGDDYAVGDKHLKHWAYGAMQVRQPAVDDVNFEYGTNYRAGDTIGNRALSIEIFNKYMDIYAKGRSDEQKARIWNGGPNGFTKKVTEDYWNKVKIWIT